MNRLTRLDLIFGRRIQTVFLRNFSFSRPCYKSTVITDREELKNSNRIVVKLGSAVITREDEYGIALGRLSSIVEQISELQNSGKQMLMVTSGAVAFGKHELAESLIMGRSLRETMAEKKLKIRSIDPRACAASGQSGLMALYSAMFNQYGISIAQVLVNKRDFYNEFTRMNLKATLRELLKLNIIPILNTNDAIAPSPEKDSDIQGVISIKDNDSLAARLAVLIESDFLLIMSDVDGIYNNPPSQPDSYLLHTYNPNGNDVVNFGDKSNVGTGGMSIKIEAATWALRNKCAVVICNGAVDRAIVDTMNGKNIGTFFTDATNDLVTSRVQAIKARSGGKKLQQLSAQERSSIILDYASKLKDNLPQILEANTIDLNLAKEKDLGSALLRQLVLTEKNIEYLINDMHQIASNTNILGRVVKTKRLTDETILQQVTIPMGVLMVILESRPYSLPQICSLAISSGNALLLKSGPEASNTNKLLHKLIEESLENLKIPKETISLLSPREEISDFLDLDEKYIDLIVPLGSKSLVKEVQKQSRSIPVLGHAGGGICHVFVDRDANPEMAVKLVRDSKCDNPAACNSVGTLLIDRSLANSQVFNSLIEMLAKENVKLYSGPLFHKVFKFAPPLAKNLRHEYSDLELTIELVDDVSGAIDHINKYGNSHTTDTIITNNPTTASQFIKNIDSACVFHNSSTRIADGYWFGPQVGVEHLLSTKWVLFGNGETAAEFVEKEFVGVEEEGGHRFVL